MGARRLIILDTVSGGTAFADIFHHFFLDFAWRVLVGFAFHGPFLAVFLEDNLVF